MNNVDLETTNGKERRNRRTNAEIKKSIFDAVLQIIKEKGFTALSINLISEYSMLTPISINKRFKDIDDIIEQFISRYDYWLDFFIDGNDEATKEAYKETIESVLDIIWKKKAIQQILVWQVTEDSSLLDTVVDDQNNAINTLTERYAELFKESGYDIRLITAILLAAIFYISAYKKKASFCGLDLKGHLGNIKLLEGINQISDLFFNEVTKSKEKEMAKKLLKYGDNMDKIIDITGLSQEEIEALQ